MIQEFISFMTTLLVARFIMNDIPHILDRQSEGPLANPNRGNFSFLDPAMRSLVAALNRAGFETYLSCEGHLSMSGEVTNAYIVFAGIVEEEQVRSVISQHTTTPFTIHRTSQVVDYSKPKRIVDEVVFIDSLRSQPTASPERAVLLLEDLVRGKNTEKILSMYNVKDLEEMRAVYRISYPELPAEAKFYIQNMDLYFALNAIQYLANSRELVDNLRIFTEANAGMEEVTHELFSELLSKKLIEPSEEYSGYYAITDEGESIFDVLLVLEILEATTPDKAVAQDAIAQERKASIEEIYTDLLTGLEAGLVGKK